MKRRDSYEYDDDTTIFDVMCEIMCGIVGFVLFLVVAYLFLISTPNQTNAINDLGGESEFGD